MSVPDDRFDEIRRKWIASNQRSFIFQKRRAEILACQIRNRATENSGARVDPADDNVIHHFLVRMWSNNTPYAIRDAVIIFAAALLAPLGWPLGFGLYKLTTQLIPVGIRSYPIAAFMWAAVVIGLPIPLLYGPTDSLIGTVFLPYLFAQIPAAALSAGVYGVLEGWLAVAGSRDWWPMRPPPVHEVVDFGWERDDMTPPGVFPTRETPDPGERTPILRFLGRWVARGPHGNRKDQS
jgi:hypothetical protein